MQYTVPVNLLHHGERRSSPCQEIYPAHGDAIRIVPLHVPDTVRTPTAEAAAT